MSSGDPGPDPLSWLFFVLLFVFGFSYIAVTLLRRSLEELFPHRIFAIYKAEVEENEKLPYAWLHDPTFLKFGFRWLGELFIILSMLILGASLGTAIIHDAWGFVVTGAACFATFFGVGQVLPAVYLGRCSEHDYRVLLQRMNLVVRVVFPLLRPLYSLTNTFSGDITIGNGDETSFRADDEVRAYLDAGARAGVLDEHENTMLQRVLELDEKVVRDVMTPRPDIVAISDEASYEEVVELIYQHPKSRIPVYHDTIDNIVGIFYGKDYVTALGSKEPMPPLSEMLRDVYFIPETKVLSELLSDFQRKKVHIAIVSDEYGGTSGMVTIEDLLEEIVGEIIDEHDPAEEKFIMQWGGDRRYMVSARTPISALERELDIEVDDEDFGSVGGFMLHRFERMPEVGDTFDYQGWRFVIDRADERRVHYVRVHPTEDVPDPRDRVEVSS